MRALATVFLFSALAFTATAQDLPRYSKVRVQLTDRAGLGQLAQRGVAFDHAAVAKGALGLEAVMVLREDDLARLAQSGFAFEVEIADLAAFYRAQPRPTEAEMAAARSASRVRGFEFGSMAGYHTFAEVVEELDALAAAYPHLVAEKVSLGTTGEGRDIWVLKVSANPQLDEDEPEVMFTALHHAREPQSMATLFYTLHYLLENYGTDPEATYLLDNRQLYFIPVLNPDGYVYNETTNPQGGGMWRKNRRNNGGGSYGVDLNRNYGYLWGRDDIGSSPFAGSEVYRGPSAFSEPETAAIRSFLMGRRIRAAFNYHSFADVLLHPWGYDYGLETPDHDAFTAISDDMTRVNGYEYGLGADILYPTNGGADDYAYGAVAETGRVFSWTPEVGNGDDGFWPTLAPGGRVERIIELADENLSANLSLAWFAGAYPIAEAVELVEMHEAPNGYLDPGEPGALVVTLRNIGLEGLAGARARVISTDPALPVEETAFGAPFDLAAQAVAEVGPLAFTLGASAPLGLQAGLALEIEVEGERFLRPLGPVAIGTPTVVFEDDASSLGRWDTGTGWGLSSQHTSPPTSFADTPSGNYANGADNALTLLDPLDLSSGAAPRLSFRARWDLEDRFDFVQVLASTDGQSWTPLAGRHTRRGSGNGPQLLGQPGYDGTQTDWVHEEMDLSAFEGAPALYLRFRLRSDFGVVADGFYLDDLTVHTFSNAATVANEAEGSAPGEVRLHAGYPNPFRDAALLPFTLPAPASVRVTIYDLLGRPVRTLADAPFPAGYHGVTWDGRDDGGRLVPGGVYVYELRAGDARASRRIVVLR